jgi:metal-responsive CopG/Arc/MetJ family transcriptional regulator
MMAREHVVLFVRLDKRLLADVDEIKRATMRVRGGYLSRNTIVVELLREVIRARAERRQAARQGRDPSARPSAAE